MFKLLPVLEIGDETD